MKHGFSLVELSIVLVILGLLVGGILTGRELIKAAEIRGFMSDIDEQKIALSLFKTKYNGLPGDITYATRFWLPEASCPDFSTDKTLTCDGNGDGKIDGTMHVWSEYINVPIQMELAGLTRYDFRNGFEGHRITSIGFFEGWALIGTNGRYHQGQFENRMNGLAIQFLLNNTFNGAWGRAVANPNDMWVIDKKYDDGKPLRGWIVGVNDDDPATPEDCYDANKDYIVGNTGSTGCTVVMWLD